MPGTDRNILEFGALTIQVLLVAFLLRTLVDWVASSKWFAGPFFNAMLRIIA